MSEETKNTSASASTNAEAEKDVQNLLAELKADEGQKGEEKDEDKVANGGATDEAAEEARIVAEAAKLGADSEMKEKKDESNEKPKTEQRGDRARPRANHRENIKSDVTSQQESSDPDAIRKQVAFYFSDSNLPMDKFLLSKVGGSANNAVDLSLLHSFKRMRHFQPLSAIVEALKSSEAVDLVDNDTKVRRKTALPESVNDFLDPNVVKVFEDEAMGRSIYAKGFGEEVPSTQFDIEAFFAPYGPTNAIRLRRTWDKIFKGSVFVEFDTEESQKKFLALDPKPKWKGHELLIKSKKDYCDEKVKEIEAGRLRPNSQGFRGRGRGRGRGGRGGRGDHRNNRDNRDWRERRSEDQKKGFHNGGRGNHRGRERDEEPPKSNIKKDARGVPVIQSTVAENKPASAGQKRTREDDGGQATGNGAAPRPPAKKVDVKEG